MSLNLIFEIYSLLEYVFRFNAYFIHGSSWGEEKPEKEDTVYEFLFPIPEELNFTEPDIHHLESFGPIDFAQINYNGSLTSSNLWESSTDEKDYEIRWQNSPEFYEILLGLKH